MGLTQEDILAAEKFHYVIDRNMKYIHKWWVPASRGMVVDVNDELAAKVREHTLAISAEAAQITGYYGMSIFHQLVDHNYYEEVELLLQKGIDPNVRGKEGKGNYTEAYKGITALHLCCYHANYKMFQLLLKYGADMNLLDSKGRNCYHFLASHYYSYMHYHGESDNEELRGYRISIAKQLTCDINQVDCDGVTPLLRLMQNDNWRYSEYLTQLYLELGADAYAADKEGNTALIYAVKNKHVTATGLLVKYKDLLNRQNNEGDAAVNKAFFNGAWNPAGAYWLTDAGADLNIRNNKGECMADLIEAMVAENKYRKFEQQCLTNKPLTIPDYFKLMDEFARDWWGYEHDDYNSFVYMIARKVLRKIDKDDDTEMVYAIKLLEKLVDTRIGEKAIDLFAEEGYDFSQPICEGRQVMTLRDICMERAWRNPAVLTKLMEHQVDLNAVFAEGRTPANIVADKIVCKGCGEHVHKAVAEMYQFINKESMELLDNEGMAAIHHAAQDNCYTLIDSMIEKRVNLNLTTDVPAVAGNTALHVACTYHKPEIVKRLIEAGADDTLLNNRGETAAHCLFSEHWYYDGDTCYDIIQYLRHVDIPHGENGKTLLMQVMQKNGGSLKRLTELLLEKGVDVTRKDKDGMTALLYYLEHNCNSDVVKKLMKAGADINARSKDGSCALHYICKRGNVELARYLIKKGADYRVVNDKGISPADIAAEEGLEMVLELMV